MSDCMVHYLCDYVVVLHILIYTPMIVPPWLKNKTLDLDRRPSRSPHTRQPWPRHFFCSYSIVGQTLGLAANTMLLLRYQKV